MHSLFDPGVRVLQGNEAGRQAGFERGDRPRVPVAKLAPRLGRRSPPRQFDVMQKGFGLDAIRSAVEANRADLDERRQGDAVEVAEEIRGECFGKGRLRSISVAPEAPYLTGFISGRIDDSADEPAFCVADNAPGAFGVKAGPAPDPHFLHGAGASGEDGIVERGFQETPYFFFFGLHRRLNSFGHHVLAACGAGTAIRERRPDPRDRAAAPLCKLEG